MELEVKQNLRPCIVEKEGKALFHRWVDSATTVPAILQGQVSGQVWHVYGLVEFEDGSIDYVHPMEIKFLDSEGIFKEFDWGK